MTKTKSEQKLQQVPELGASIEEKLNLIQTELKAPKGNFNSFGKYHYRSCEDILESLKPLLKQYRAVVLIDDTIVQVGERYYIVATATIMNAEEGNYGTISVKAYAREPDSRKGMNDAQVTGSTSSYARKYALNGLFCIDDTKDADSSAPAEKPKDKPKNAAPPPTPKEVMFAKIEEAGIKGKEQAKEFIESRIGREIKSSNDLTVKEIKKVAEDAEKIKEEGADNK